MAADLGRYEFLEVLAVRPTTELFLVRISGDGGFDRRIALKRLRDDKRAAQFIEDAKLGANLSHPKIVQIIELGSLSGVPYVAMEYVNGIDLLGLMRELSRAQKLIEPAIAVWIIHELLAALEYTHGLADRDGAPLGISHGRLTPSKVMIDASGEIKLRDFGGARAHGLDVQHAGNDYAYVAPEQVAALPSDARTDVYAAGVVLAELLIGRRLFAASSEFDMLMRVRDGNVSRFDARAAELGLDLVDIVHTALDRRMEHRWPTAGAFRDALADWLFEHRHRVSHLDVAKVVATVRDEVDAWRRAHGPSLGPTPELDDAPKAVQPTTLPPVKFDWSNGDTGIKHRTRTIEIPPLVRPAPPRERESSAPLGVEPPNTASTPPSAAPAVEPRPRRARERIDRSAFAGLSPLAKEERPRLSTRGALHPQRAAPTPRDGVKPLAPHAVLQPADSIGAAVEAILPQRTVSDAEDP